MVIFNKEKLFMCNQLIISFYFFEVKFIIVLSIQVSIFR